jgi:hypothetical protein
MNNDIFRPHTEPARSIYDAFQAEAAKRAGRSIEAWQSAERDAVLREAIFQAQKLSLTPPTQADVCNAELSAMGHIDYGAKWAYRVAETMQKAAPHA